MSALAWPTLVLGLKMRPEGQSGPLMGVPPDPCAGLFPLYHSKDGRLVREQSDPGRRKVGSVGLHGVGVWLDRRPGSIGVCGSAQGTAGKARYFNCSMRPVVGGRA